MYEGITSHVVAFWAFIAACVGLVGVWIKVRGILRGWYNSRREWRDSLAKMPTAIKHLAESVGFLLADRENEKHRVPYPYFECDESGINTLTSNAYRELCGVTSDRDLDDLDWINAIHPADRDDYVIHFNRMALTRSHFIDTIRFQNPITEAPRGRWKVDAVPIPRGVDVVYAGTITPVDDYAKEIALRQGWLGADEPSAEQAAGSLMEVLERMKKIIGNGTSIAYPLQAQDGREVTVPIDKEWTEMLPHMEMRWVTMNNDETVFDLRCVGGVTMPIHSHHFTETIEVISGKMIDTISDCVFKRGDVWNIRPEEKHGATLLNACLRITAQGRMQKATHQNIIMESMRALVVDV